MQVEQSGLIWDESDCITLKVRCLKPAEFFWAVLSPGASFKAVKLEHSQLESI